MSGTDSAGNAAGKRTSHPVTASWWGDLVGLIDRTSSLVFANPLTSIQFAAALALLAAGAWTFSIWDHDLFYGTEDVRGTVERARGMVEVPLVLLGVFSIVIIITRTESAFALGMSVLIIGTVVAGERFLLFGAAVLRGDPDIVDQTRSVYEDERYPDEPGEIQNKRLRRVLAEQTDLTDEDLDTLVRRLEADLQAQDLRPVVERIRGQGTETVLTALFEGGASWRNFLEQFGQEGYFRSDMQVLRDEGLVSFDADRYGAAALTPLGQRVAQQLVEEEAEWIRPAGSIALPEAPVPSGPNDATTPRLEIPTTTTIDLVDYQDRWFRLRLDEAGEIALETRRGDAPERVDTTLTVYDEAMERIARDDDGGSGLYSRVVLDLEPGTYFVQAATYFGGAGRFDLEVGAPEDVEATP
jgi:hypothetical protein